MNVKEYIKKILDQQESVTGKELLAGLGISRQALNKHIKELIENGLIYKIGVTRGVLYKKSTGKQKQPSQQLRRNYEIMGLEEDRAYQEFDNLLGLSQVLSANVYSIFQYAFTEMLNNAIDHSISSRCSVEVGFDDYQVSFKIRDYGIGVFYSIYSNFDLKDESEAVGEILKGRSTTMAEKHSGEGIFFTSKVGDYVQFRSHSTLLKFDNGNQEIFLEKQKRIEGTEVCLRISRRSRRRLETIFQKFAPEEFDFKFEKTQILVTLFEDEFLSRSSAKRLLQGLDKYRVIILDFKKVRKIGQGFADEIFRVFKKSNPEIEIQVQNTSKPVDIMIRHVVDNKI
ncbi:MAG: DUF4325 domain-containing protein [Candidatus Marinimicrobia bacterium]|nr:DUF4325 domain-containing protein [Candidatus Neomarinimicrobiota bacterium]